MGTCIEHETYEKQYKYYCNKCDTPYFSDYTGMLHCCKCKNVYHYKSSHSCCTNCKISFTNGHDCILKYCYECKIKYDGKYDHCCECKSVYDGKYKHCCECKSVYIDKHCCKCKIRFESENGIFHCLFCHKTSKSKTCNFCNEVVIIPSQKPFGT